MSSSVAPCLESPVSDLGSEIDCLEVLLGVLQSLQLNAPIILQIRTRPLSSESFHFIIYWKPYYSILRNLSF